MTAPDGLTMRARILARLPADEAAWLAHRLPDDIGGCPVPDRVEALAAALALFPSVWPTHSAKALQRALDGYLSDRFAADRLAGAPPAHDAVRVALFRLATANDGRPLGWRRIHDLAACRLQEIRPRVATAAR